MGNGQAVRHWVLVPGSGVQIPLPQPSISNRGCDRVPRLVCLNISMPDRGEQLGHEALDFTDIDLGLLDPPQRFILEETYMPEIEEKRVGKVRDIYEQPGRVLLVATDRYSAFDRNLALVPYKGETVTQISRWWFDRTRHIIDNHAIGYPDPNVTVAQRCDVLPVEMIVRGFVTSVTNTSLWKTYDKGQRDFGDFILPDNLHKNQRLNHPVITPSTKLETHDRNLTLDSIVKEGLVDTETRDRLVSVALELFGFGQHVAREHSLVLVDTKYEFGINDTGEIILIDELHTPDSSRYWQMADYSEKFEQRQEPENYDKEFLRLWFQTNSRPYDDEFMPDAPKGKVMEMTRRYIQVYQQLTGQPFRPDLITPVRERIMNNLLDYTV